MGLDMVSSSSLVCYYAYRTEIIIFGFRLLYRAYQVCQTPNDILVEKLGLDIPPAPDVTLEEISSTRIRIAWKHPDLQHSIHKHLIQVNGVKGLFYLPLRVAILQVY